MKKRIVISDTNCLTSLGLGSDLLEKELLIKKTKSIPPIKYTLENTGFKVGCYRCVDDSFQSLIEKSKLRRLDRFARMNIATLKQLELEDFSNAGYIMGTTYGTWNSTNKYTMDLVNEGVELCSPRLFPNTVLNAAQGQVCIYYQIKGEASTVTGVNSLTYAYDLIQRGFTECVIVVGADELCDNLMEMSVAEESKITYGEGIGAVVLQSLDFAKRNNSKILCEVTEYSTKSDYMMSEDWRDCDSSGKTLIDAFENLNNKVTNTGKTCLLLSSNGEDNLQETENNFIKYFKDNYCSEFDTFNAKPLIGETFGAAGIINIIMGALAIHNEGYDVAYSLDYQLGGNQTIVRMERYVT